MRFEVDCRGGDELADQATRFPVVLPDFFLPLEHFRVRFPLHVRFEDDPRVELEIARLAGKAALVGGINLGISALFSSPPLFVFEGFDSRNWAEGFRGHERVIARNFQLPYVRLARQVNVKHAER